jgi:mRNA interferase MazF
MGIFTVGEIVLVPFPYADFTKLKKRPALVVGEAEFSNLILCQVTSKARTSKRAIDLTDNDFVDGGLPVESFLRPDKLFTVEPNLIESRLGHLNDSKLSLIKDSVQSLFV